VEGKGVPSSSKQERPSRCGSLGFPPHKLKGPNDSAIERLWLGGLDFYGKWSIKNHPKKTPCSKRNQRGVERVHVQGSQSTNAVGREGTNACRTGRLKLGGEGMSIQRKAEPLFKYWKVGGHREGEG